MINITLRAERYTPMELHKLIRPRFLSNEDVTLFINAMIQTRQIEQIGIYYYFPNIQIIEEPVEGWATINIIAGGSTTTRIRWGFTQPDSWIWGVPQNIEFTEVIVNGVHHTVPEALRPPYIKKWRTMKPRGGRWRMSIPSQLQQAFNIKRGDQVKFKAEETIKNYYATLTLWGYVMSSQITYDYDNPKKPERQRHVELNGTNFINEFSINIREDADVFNERIINTMKDLLASYGNLPADEDYLTVLSDFCEETIVGYILEQPLTESENIFAEVKLWGTQAGAIMGKIITKWRTVYPMNHLPNRLDFQEV